MKESDADDRKKPAEEPQTTQWSLAVAARAASTATLREALGPLCERADSPGAHDHSK